MASKVGIINRAFHHLGLSRIDNPSENEPQAITIEDVYVEDLKSLLSQHLWKFAVKWQVLPRLVGQIDSPFWLYWFEVPSSPYEKIRLINLRAYGTSCVITDYDYNGNRVYCNTPNIYAKYLAYISDPNMMTPMFRELLSMKLAISICIPHTNSLQLRNVIQEQYDKLLPDAISVDTSDDALDPIPQTGWVSEFYGNA